MFPGQDELLSRFQPLPERGGAGCVTVAVAEDDAVSRKVILRQLERFSVETIGSADGLKLINAIRRHPVEAVFLDLNMPVMDGWTAARSIRSGQAGPQNQDTLLVAISTEPSVASRERCRSCGFDWFLEKPLSLFLLGRILDRIGVTAGPDRHPGSSGGRSRILPLSRRAAQNF